MNNQRYYPGPYWTMNSSEAGASFLLVCFILAIPALPAGMFGWFIGEHMIGNNFAKLGLMILFFWIDVFFCSVYWEYQRFMVRYFCSLFRIFYLGL